MVYASLDIGTGFAGYREVAASLSTKPLDIHSYYTVRDLVGKTLEDKYAKSMVTARSCIIEQYRRLGIEPDEDGLLDIDVAFDGSWLTRGHMSLIGMAAVIEAHTGFVVDYEVLSSLSCSKLENQKKNKKISSEQYEAQKQKHETDCQRNYIGKSGSMEPEAAWRMWHCSERKNKMRYTVFISDGDSKVFNNVRDSYPYNVPTEKEECVNHVSKSLGTRLRKLKAETFEVKTTKAGKK